MQIVGGKLHTSRDEPDLVDQSIFQDIGAFLVPGQGWGEWRAPPCQSILLRLTRFDNSKWRSISSSVCSDFAHTKFSLPRHVELTSVNPGCLVFVVGTCTVCRCSRHRRRLPIRLSRGVSLSVPDHYSRPPPRNSSSMLFPIIRPNNECSSGCRDICQRSASRASVSHKMQEVAFPCRDK
jgi:hypothetical protein